MNTYIALSLFLFEMMYMEKCEVITDLESTKGGLFYKNPCNIIRDETNGELLTYHVYMNDAKAGAILQNYIFFNIHPFIFP